jgi:hypothetical protein
MASWPQETVELARVDDVIQHALRQARTFVQGSGGEQRVVQEALRALAWALVAQSSSSSAALHQLPCDKGQHDMLPASGTSTAHAPAGQKVLSGWAPVETDAPQGTTSDQSDVRDAAACTACRSHPAEQQAVHSLSEQLRQLAAEKQQLQQERQALAAERAALAAAAQQLGWHTILAAVLAVARCKVRCGHAAVTCRPIPYEC